MQKQRFIKRNDGNTAIEFALVAPVLFLLVMGIMEFALIMFAAMVIENAATSAARLGITGDNYASRQADPKNAATSEDFIKSEVKRYSGGLLDEEKVNIDFVAHDSLENAAEDSNKGTSGLGAGNQGVTYEITYDWKLFTPLIAKFFEGHGDVPPGVYRVSSFVVVKNEAFESRK